MANDLGVLLPTESQYGNPGAYTEAIRAEATKQATYLSNMDQFYAQLDESKRQFDLNYAAREKEFDWTSKFEEKKLTVESGFAERKLQLEEKAQELTRQIKEKELQFAETQLGFQRETLGFEKEKLQAELEKMRQEIGLAREGMDLQKTLGLGSLDVQRYSVELEGNYKMGSLDLQRQSTAFDSMLKAAQFNAGVDQAFPGGIAQPRTGMYSGYGRPPTTVKASSVYGVSSPSYTANYRTVSPVSDYYSKWSK